MRNLKKSLKEFLKNASKIGLLGIGSELRSDDAAGMLVAELVQVYSGGAKPGMPLKVFMGATAPENLTGEIKKFAPSHLIFVDTASFGGKPGDIMVLKPENVNNYSFSTHKLPIKVMIDYLLQSIRTEVLIIGIQPKSIEFGEPPSSEIKEAVKGVAKIIEEVLNA